MVDTGIASLYGTSAFDKADSSIGMNAGRHGTASRQLWMNDASSIKSFPSWT